MTQSTTYYHDDHRDVAVAIALANCSPDEGLTVHNQDGSIDYVLSPVEVQFIQDQMRKALEVTK